MLGSGKTATQLTWWEWEVGKDGGSADLLGQWQDGSSADLVACEQEGVALLISMRRTMGDSDVLVDRWVHG